MESKYGGMTVNERLYLSGLMDQFDKALLRKDTNTLISILKEVELNNTNINAILKSQNLPKNSE
jgi:hypothetical protein